MDKLEPGTGRIVKAARTPAGMAAQNQASSSDGDPFEAGIAYAVARGFCWPADELMGPHIALALKLAQELMQERLAVDSEVERRLVHKALAKLNPKTWAIVRVHPDSATRLRPLLPSHIRLETDVQLLPGECIIDSDQGTLDARLDIRIKALERALVAVTRNAPSSV